MTAVDVVVLLAAGLLTVFIVAHLATALDLYRGARSRRGIDVSPRRVPLPPAAAAIAGELALLGFSRLGEAEYELPDVGWLGPLGRRRRRHIVWIHVDPAATTLAELTAIGPLLSLSSELRDGSVVETMFPTGERIDDRDFYSGHVSTSVLDAYTSHRLVVDVRTAAHGQPRDINGMGDYLRMEAHFRERFALRKLRGPTIRNAVVPAVVGLALALTLIAAVVGPR